MTTTLRLFCFIAVVGAAAAQAVPVPTARPHTYGCPTGAVYGLLQVSTSSETNFVEPSVDSGHVIGKPATIPTATLATTSSSYCGTTGVSTTADANYPTTADVFKGMMMGFLASDNSRDYRIPQQVLLYNTSPNPGTKFVEVQKVEHGGSGVYNTCTIDGSDQYYKMKFCDPK